MPMQETRQESKTVPLRQPAAPAGPAQTANTPRSHSLALKDRSRLALTGVTRIISCDENAAVLETPLGNLTVGWHPGGDREFQNRRHRPLAGGSPGRFCGNRACCA